METTEKRPNYFKLLLDSPEGHDHPIDQAARERIDADAAEARIRELQGKVTAQLGKKTKAFMALEDQRADLSDRRAEAYFNLGFERGLLEGAARASRPATSERIQQVARELLEHLAQAQLSPDEAALVAHEVLGGVLLSGPTALASGRALASGTPQ